MKEGKIIKKFLFQGKQIIIRHPRSSDLNDFLSLINSLVQEKAYLSLQKKLTYSQEKKWLAESMKKIAQKQKIILVLEVNGKVLGNTVVEKMSEKSQEHIGVFGIILDQSIRGLGLAPKMAKMVMDEAVKNMKVKIIKLSVLNANRRAFKVYKKLGFQKIGVIKKGFRHYGAFCDDIIMVKYF